MSSANPSVNINPEGAAVAEDDKLEKSLYKYILKHTLRDQVILVVVTLLSMPLVYLALDVPKTIINEALSGSQSSFVFLGLSLTQIQYLLALSGLFLLLVLVNGLVKYFVNVYRGVLGERMLRRLRYQLYSRIIRFPMAHLRRTSPAEITPIVTAETEPLGGFIGESIGLPVFQGGLLITYVTFIFLQDVWLGIASVALYPFQLVVIPVLQRRINTLARQRVQTVRKLSDRIGETLNAVPDIRVNDTSEREQADISSRLGTIFSLRNEIYRRKFFVKFLNNFLGQLTPFFFYSIGGVLVIKGQLSLGALVAVLAAYKDIGPPWKELLKFYQTLEDVKVKYTQVIDQFDMPGMLPDSQSIAKDNRDSRITKSISGNAVSLAEEFHSGKLKKLDISLRVAEHTVIYTLDPDAGRELMMLLATLEKPTAGALSFDEYRVAEIPPAVVGRSVGYCSQETLILNTSVRNNICYGLMHNQVTGSGDNQLASDDLRERRATGNSIQDIDGEWVDIGLAGYDSDQAFEQRLLGVLDTVDLGKEVLTLGLDSRLGADTHQSLSNLLVEARKEIVARMPEDMPDADIEWFDADVFSENMTLAENMLFGIPVSAEGMDANQLTSLQATRNVLKQSGLDQRFLDIGEQIAQLMLELFEGVDEYSELFEQFSFIEADKLEEFRLLLRKADGDAGQKLNSDEKFSLVSLAFKYCPARHRLVTVDDTLKQQIVSARQQVVAEFGASSGLIQFLQRDRYMVGMTIRENLLFGRLPQNRSHLQPELDLALESRLEKLGVSDRIRIFGLEFICGSGGAKLPSAFRNKVALARALIKNPDILIADNILGNFDSGSRAQILAAVKKERQGRNLIWASSSEGKLEDFDRQLLLSEDRLEQIG